MAGKLNKFQMVGFNHWKGLTKENHLGSIFQLAPQKATTLMVQLLAYYRGKTLDTFLSQFPTKEFDTDDEYTWDVVGSSRRNIPLVEARNAAGSVISAGLAGANGEPFYVVFLRPPLAVSSTVGIPTASFLLSMEPGTLC